MKTVIILGASRDRAKFGNKAVRAFRQQGYTVYPVNPKETEVLGERSYARLEDVPEKPDIVDVFRRSEAVPEVVDSAIRVGAAARNRQTEYPLR